MGSQAPVRDAARTAVVAVRLALSLRGPGQVANLLRLPDLPVGVALSGRDDDPFVGEGYGPRGRRHKKQTKSMRGSTGCSPT